MPAGRVVAWQAEAVAARVDQSCHRCASGEKCVYAGWSTAYIWLEVEQRLQLLIECPQGPCAWCAHASRAIQNLMWHYGQRVYTVKTLEGPGAEKP